MSARVQEEEPKAQYFLNSSLLFLRDVLAARSRQSALVTGLWSRLDKALGWLGGTFQTLVQMNQKF